MRLPKFTKDGKIFPNSNFSKDNFYKSCNLDDAKKIGGYVYLNAIRKANNSRWALMKNGYVFIKNIFIDYWDDFKLIYHKLLTRTSIIDNIERFLKCENMECGFHYFKCPNGCGCHIQCFTCKSRFCPKCGKIYRDKRSAKIAGKLIKAPHRQFVFSVPEEYRYFFQKYHFLLNILFSAVSDSFNFLLGNNKGIAKKEHRQLGFISFLHTFGRDMKWNPHLHVLIAERYINISNEIKKFDYFPFEKLRKTYMFFLMRKIYSALANSEIADKADVSKLFLINKKLFHTFSKGFYVHGPKLKNHSISSVKAIANYISRYASHPAISERRITSYDKELNLVSWFYDPHEDVHLENEDDKLGRQFISEHPFEFIKRLIIHIPDKYFHQVRYYGFYSNNSRLLKSSSLFSKKQLKAMENDTLWIRGLINTFGYSPLICDVCGQRMHLSLDDSYFPNLKRGASP